MTKTIKQKNIFEILVQGVIILSLFILPYIVYAQGAPTGPNSLTYECFSGGVYGNCTFDDVIRATQNIINQIIPLVLGFTVVVIAYAGFKYMISGDNPGERASANKMLRSVVIGIFFMMAAWLIVTLIARALLTPAVINVTPVVVP